MSPLATFSSSSWTRQTACWTKALCQTSGVPSAFPACRLRSRGRPLCSRQPSHRRFSAVLASSSTIIFICRWISYWGRFPQICTVCYSVTFKNPNISSWSWSKIVDNTFSVCTNNIKKHIGSPPRPFISFLKFILVKGMSHCNICWFKWFCRCKKWQFQC